MRDQEQSEQWSDKPLSVQRGGEPPPSRERGKRSRNRHQRRVIRRQVREIPPESNLWFAVGLAAIGIAAGSAVAAATVVDGVTTRAILWTVAACIALAGVSYLIVHHDVNRGRRVKRSEVVEEYSEE